MTQTCIFCTIIFSFTDTATTEIYTLSLHDALPISNDVLSDPKKRKIYDQLGFYSDNIDPAAAEAYAAAGSMLRSEEHTSELQSRRDLVCRLLLEKKKKDIEVYYHRLQKMYAFLSLG